MKLLCTDLDRTLLPNGMQAESVHARPLLWHLLKTHELVLAYVTGRDLARVLDAVNEYALPLPDVIVGDVGSTIYMQAGAGWENNKDWQQMIARQWAGRDSAYIHELLVGINGLQVLEADRQTAFKRSYYVKATENESELQRQIEMRLADKGISAALVFSHDPEKQCGLLDVLPGLATKREAVAYLQSVFELTERDVLFAGDSGNDVSAICAAHPAVLVANADDDTRKKVYAENSQSPDPALTYVASGGLEVVGQDSLNGFYAAGIVEGLIHFRPEWRQHLSDASWVEAAMQDANIHNSQEQ